MADEKLPSSAPELVSRGSAPELQLGYVAGAHGIQGALRIKLFNSDSDTLRPDLILHLRTSEGRDAGTRRVTRVAPKPGSELARVWLEGIERREDAEALRGLEVWVAREDLPQLETDEYYLADLIGLEVVRAGAGEGEFESLGRIVDVTSNGIQDLFEVRLGSQTWLLPVLPHYLLEIELERVIVDVDDELLPEGRA
jgi:16S rRNA processing protein RimM